MRIRSLGARSLVPFLFFAGVAHAQGFASDPARALAHAADANGDGAVSADEWSAFRASLPTGGAADLDRDGVAARVLAVDGDRDGRLTEADVRRFVATGDASTGRGRSTPFLGALLPQLADANADGRLTEDERAAFLGEVRYDASGVVEHEQVRAWLAAADGLTPGENRNAMTPSVVLVTFTAGLDADASGAVTLADLDALHAVLDANADGILDADELSVSRRSAAGLSPGRWTVSRESRRKPPLMPWQRTLDDALALSRATGKPLLLCVNMDGENASESLAWRRYRDPEFVELASGFVPLIASPDRRDPREHDDRGRRLPDERFGRVINSEHIDIEPLLFERYFDGRRVAPRHVGVSPEGEILFDVFLVQDLSIIDAKLREFGKPTPEKPSPAEMWVDTLLTSPDAAHRDELEARFVAAEEPVRVGLASQALSAERRTQHPELVRLALRDPSPSVRRAGAAVMAMHMDRAPLELVPAAFTVDESLAPALLAGLERRAAEETDEAVAQQAAALWRAQVGLHTPSSALDVERWRLALRTAPELPAETLDEADIDATIDLLGALDEALSRTPQDLELELQLVATRMRLARLYAAAGRNPTYFFEDVVSGADEILASHPDEGRALGYRAFGAYMLADMEAAADFAARALPLLVRDAGTRLAANVLHVLADTRTRAIYAAMGRDEAWEPDLLAEASAAYEVLLVHSGGTEAQATAYLDLLGALRAHGREGEALRVALGRHPASGELHRYLRSQLLRDEGARALEAVYDEEPLRSARAEHGPTLDWFHGLATLVAAERDVENRAPRDAWDAYHRSRERFQAALEAQPEFAAASAHYQCLALAGAAKLQVDAERYGEAIELLVEAVRTAPDSAYSPDGLGNTPVETARELRRTLVRQGEGEKARSFEDRLAGLGLSVGATREAGSAR